jgi:hypothetical protein
MYSLSLTSSMQIFLYAVRCVITCCMSGSDGTDFGNLFLKRKVCRDSMNVGACYHGMARAQVADGGTASNTEGSCE